MEKSLLYIFSRRIACHVDCSVYTSRRFVRCMLEHLDLQNTLHSGDPQAVKDALAQVDATYMAHKEAFDTLLQQDETSNDKYLNVLPAAS
jgi:hypothetical protein